MSDRDRDKLDQQLRQVEALLETLERVADPAARTAAREMLQTLLALHRAGLGRMLEMIRQAESGPALVTACGADDLVGRLLLLHGLHPVDLETRVRQALDQVRPMVRGHGGELELVSANQQVVRVRLQGDCSLSGPELQQLMEEAFLTIAPDVEVIEVEDTPRAENSSRRLALLLVPAPESR
jgi:Fe-S cluster biogenesis protein NfuA